MNWYEVGDVLGKLGRIMRDFGILHIVDYCLELIMLPDVLPGVERFMENLELSRVNAVGNVHIVLLCWIFYLAVYAAVLYIPTRLLLKKKLNLP